MTLTLYYLNIRARGEIPRFILKYGNIDYVDVAIPINDWPQYKYDDNICHFGNVPSITLNDGKVISQSAAIVHYCAKLAGIYPIDPIEAAEADMVFELAQEIIDINPLLNAVTYDSESYHTRYDNYFKTLPSKLVAVSKILENVQTVISGYLNEYPNLVKWDHEIRSLPAIKAYLESRPSTGPLIGFE
eukprot:gene38903-52542_t